MPGDQGLYYATWNLANPWSNVTPIPGDGSSFSPSIAIVGASPVLAWTGIEGVAGLYWSTFSGGWAPQSSIGGRGTSARPALAADPVTGVPRMVWKGVTGDHTLYTARVLQPAPVVIWEPQQEIAWVNVGNGGAGTVDVGRPGSQFGPALVTAGNRLAMVWRGTGDDQNLWFTQAAPSPPIAAAPGAPGQSETEWSSQARVANAGSSDAPTVASFGGNIYVAWKGTGSDHAIWTTYI